MEARGITEGERKTITALFADIKGSMELIEDLDPEEARRLFDPALQLMMEAVHRYEGYVAQSTGDGIFAFFGAPIAHEDHPQRALYAALRMQEEMRRYADRLREKGHAPLLMRVGVNTGEVVVRSIRKEDLHTDYVPVGHSTNLAARIPHKIAMELLLVGEPIDARRAYEVGYVNKIVPVAELMPAALDYARRIAATAPLPSRALKRFVAEALPKGPTEIAGMARAQTDTIFTSQDWDEGRKAFAEKRPPNYRGR